MAKSPKHSRNNEPRSQASPTPPISRIRFSPPAHALRHSENANIVERSGQLKSWVALCNWKWISRCIRGRFIHNPSISVNINIKRHAKKGDRRNKKTSSDQIRATARRLFRISLPPRSLFNDGMLRTLEIIPWTLHRAKLNYLTAAIIHNTQIHSKRAPPATTAVIQTIILGFRNKSEAARV